MNIAKKALVFTSAVSIAAGTSVPGTSVSAKTRLSGAGASFPSKIYTRWFKDLATSGGPRVNYQAVGSGSGRKAFIDQTVNFGASDDPMKDKAPSLGIVPLKGDILEKSRAAVKRIGK